MKLKLTAALAALVATTALGVDIIPLPLSLETNPPTVYRALVWTNAWWWTNSSPAARTNLQVWQAFWAINENFKRLTNAIAGLGGGGGSQTPWGSDIDGGGFNLSNAGDGGFNGSVTSYGSGFYGNGSGLNNIGYANQSSSIRNGDETEVAYGNTDTAVGDPALKVSSGAVLEIMDADKGIIMHSASKVWRITIDDSGVLTPTDITP